MAGGIGTSEHEVGSQFRDEEERRAAGGIKRQFESGSASPDDLDEAAALVSTDRHDLEAVATQSEAEALRVTRWMPVSNGCLDVVWHQ